MPLTNTNHWAQGNNGSFTRIHRQLQSFFTARGSHLLPNMQFECCVILQGTFRSNFDIFAVSGESTVWVLLWKTRSRPIGVRVCPAAQFNFSHFKPFWLKNLVASARGECLSFFCILVRRIFMPLWTQAAFRVVASSRFLEVTSAESSATSATTTADVQVCQGQGQPRRSPEGIERFHRSVGRCLQFKSELEKARQAGKAPPSRYRSLRPKTQSGWRTVTCKMRCRPGT